MFDPAKSDESIWSALREGRRFFMNDSKVDHALAAITAILDEEHIAYCLVGAMALNRYGYRRFTEDIDLLLTREGHQALKKRVLGRGYVEKFSGRKTLRDTVNGVAIDFLLAGEFPGDEEPKPVVFPEPASVAERVGSLSLLPLPKLIELKLASGMSAPHRMKDLTDVLELVRACALPLDLVEKLDASVREKYRELWTAAQGADPE